LVNKKIEKIGQVAKQKGNKGTRPVHDKGRDPSTDQLASLQSKIQRKKLRTHLRKK
jgi:hypothetical protein